MNPSTELPSAAGRLDGLKGNWRVIGAVASATLALQFALVLARSPCDSAQTLRVGVLVMLGILTLIVLCSSNALRFSALARSAIISSLGGFGMAVGIERTTDGCCQTMTDTPLPLIGMVVFCFLGCRLCPAVDRIRSSMLPDMACPLLMMPCMWIGGILLNAPLTTWLGTYGAAHSAMLVGMFWGTFAWEKIIAFSSRSTQ